MGAFRSHATPGLEACLAGELGSSSGGGGVIRGAFCAQMHGCKSISWTASMGAVGGRKSEPSKSPPPVPPPGLGLYWGGTQPSTGTHGTSRT